MLVEAWAFYRPSGPEHLRSAGETENARQIQLKTLDGPTQVARGIVAHVDLTQGRYVDEALDEHLEVSGGTLKGIRHLAARDASASIRSVYLHDGPELYDRPEFRDGLAALTRRGLSLDTYQFFHQLPALYSLARCFPDARIVIDHVGGILGVGPYQGAGDTVFDIWRRNMGELAACDNVWVKLGGLGMPGSGIGIPSTGAPDASAALAAGWRPYLETCIALFGTARCMFESNFPVDRATCSYSVLWNALKRIAAGASDDEKARLFHGSATEFYMLESHG